MFISVAFNLCTLLFSLLLCLSAFEMRIGMAKRKKRRKKKDGKRTNSKTLEMINLQKCAKINTIPFQRVFALSRNEQPNFVTKIIVVETKQVEETVFF